MSFFKRFFQKPHQLVKTSASKEARILGNTEKREIPLKPRTMLDVAAPEGERKNQRHIRREQMYVAIREAMTRAGVLSASYKFKVLSLDQGGNEFLVMMDIERVTGDSLPGLAAIEMSIAKNAEVRFQIHVPAVYWRVKEVAPVTKPMPSLMTVEAPPPLARSKVEARYEPVQRDEVDAFQQALLAASSYRPAVASAMGTKIRDALRFPSTPVRDFEDTEMTQSRSSPALSNTQYGDLI